MISVNPPPNSVWESIKELVMKREQFPLYAIAAAVLIVGLVLAGVPLGTLIVLPLILVCPLMMMFMMRGMGGMDHEDKRAAHHQPPTKHMDIPVRHDSAGR